MKSTHDVIFKKKKKKHYLYYHTYRRDCFLYVQWTCSPSEKKIRNALPPKKGRTSQFVL